MLNLVLIVASLSATSNLRFVHSENETPVSGSSMPVLCVKLKQKYVFIYFFNID